MSALFPIRNFWWKAKRFRDRSSGDRVVVGAWEDKDFAVMRGVYQRFTRPMSRVYQVNPREAAAGKLLANFLFIQ